MDELVKQLDERIAAVFAELDPLRERVRTLEQEMDRLRRAKAAISGECSPQRGGQGSNRREKIAKVLDDGPCEAAEISRRVGMDAAATTRILRSKGGVPNLGWFTQEDGSGSRYMLTEKGKNRHNAE